MVAKILRASPTASMLAVGKASGFFGHPGLSLRAVLSAVIKTLGGTKLAGAAGTLLKMFDKY